MPYRGFSGGGFVGNFLSTTLLEQLRPAADNAGRQATVGSPAGRAAPYRSDGESWKAVALIDEDTGSLVDGAGIRFLAPLADKRANWKRQFAKPALIAAALWSNNGGAGTVFVLGDKRKHSNGQLMQCLVAGTGSTTSEPTWSSTALMSDGATVKWGALGVASFANNDGYEVPTVSTGTSAPASSTAYPLYSTETGPVSSFSIAAGGTGYVDGTYANVPVTGGSGSGLIARQITVASGIVTIAGLDPMGSGSGYAITDTGLTVSNTYLGGSGSGLLLSVTRVWQGNPTWCYQNLLRTVNRSNLYSQAYILNQGGSSNPTSSGPRIIEFMTDSDVVAIATHSQTGQRNEIWVDGYQVQEDPSAMPAGTPAYVTLTWTGFKLRRYRIVVHAASASEGVALKNVTIRSQAKIYPPADLGVAGAIFTDSYGNTLSTYAPQTDAQFLGVQIMQRLGISRFVAAAIGSTGYYVGKDADDDNATATNYNARAALDYNDFSLVSDGAVVVFCHSYNDTNVAATYSNAILAWRLARTKFPSARIYVFGTWAGGTGPDATRLAVDTALAAAFTTWGDANSKYESIVQPTEGAFVSGTGKWGTLTGTGNSDYYTGADGVHPSLPGREYLVRRIVDRIENDLYSLSI